MMNFKLRLDLDCQQRLCLGVIISLIISYVGSIICCSTVWWLSLLLPLSLTLSVLKSGLQLEVGDRSVLVTGCDTGFGLALAKHLRGLGFTVFAGCLLADKAGAGAEELRQLSSPKLHVVQLDVTKQEDWDAVLQYVKKNTKDGLWGIVNNAGWATFGEVEWVSMETFKKAMDVNVHGVLAGVKTMLPLIREARGRVVTITSGLGRMAVPTRSPYVGTKYALEGILDCLRYEMRSFGVSVSILEPGNFIAGTNIFNENFVKSQANMMWDAMPQEVQSVYGREYFDKKVEVMRSYMNNGITDISPVIDAYTDALLDMFPQVFNL